MKRFAKMFIGFQILYALLGFIWVFGALLSSFLPNSIDWKTTWEVWEHATDTFEHIATIIALGVGGWWAYSKFIRERVSVPRLEPSVAAELLDYSNAKYMKVSMTVKNIGLTVFKFQHDGSGLDIYPHELNQSVSDVSSPYWDEPESFSVFTSHQWIEPGETIADQILIIIPKNEERIFKLELVFVSEKLDTQWKSVTVIETAVKDAG
jgi:Na+-transporting methylmalonyl-CoA/oxaloacetate decarboxylase gamma subunit